MKWLIDCELTTAPDHGAAAAGSPIKCHDRTQAEEVPIVESGEGLELVAGHLQTLWVYSWLGFSALPAAMMLRREVLERLCTADAALPVDYRLTVLDGWRPRAFQHELLAYYGNGNEDGGIDGYVADASPDLVPPHTTGGAVDVTLSWRGAPLGLGSDYDAFTPAAGVLAMEHATTAVAPPRAFGLRRLLADALREAGFAPFPLEWWHWSYGDQLWAYDTAASAAIYGEHEEPSIANSRVIRGA